MEGEMATPRLSDAEVEVRLRELDSWKLKDGKIVRELKFPSFLDAIEFIGLIAPVAEAADHHPEIYNVYNRVDLALVTHDSGGITEKDFDLAEQIDRLV